MQPGEERLRSVRRSITFDLAVLGFSAIVLAAAYPVAPQPVIWTFGVLAMGSVIDIVRSVSQIRKLRRSP